MRVTALVTGNLKLNKVKGVAERRRQQPERTGAAAEGRGMPECQQKKKKKLGVRCSFPLLSFLVFGFWHGF